MTPAQLHNFLIQPSQLGACMSVRELEFDLRLLGRSLGPDNEWGPMALKRQDEAQALIQAWLDELQGQGLAREIGGKWVGVVAPVVERAEQKRIW